MAAHHGAGEVDRAHGHDRQHGEQRHRIQGLGQAERRLRDHGEGVGHQDGLGLAGHEGHPAEDPHGPEGDDERVHAEPHDHDAVDRSAEQADADAEAEADQRPCPGPIPGGWARSHRAIVDPGQGVDGTHRQVDARRDDHDRGPHGHDREEARVGGGLDEGVGVQEVVDGLPGHAVRMGAREGGEQGAQQEDHEHEAGLRRAQEPAEEGGHGADYSHVLRGRAGRPCAPRSFGPGSRLWVYERARPVGRPADEEDGHDHESRPQGDRTALGAGLLLRGAAAPGPHSTRRRHPPRSRPGSGRSRAGARSWARSGPAAACCLRPGPRGRGSRSPSRSTSTTRPRRSATTRPRRECCRRANTARARRCPGCWRFSSATVSRRASSFPR